MANKAIRDISHLENDHLYEMVKVSHQYNNAESVQGLRRNMEAMFEFNEDQWEFVKTQFEEDLADQYNY